MCNFGEKSRFSSTRYTNPTIPPTQPYVQARCVPSASFGLPAAARFTSKHEDTAQVRVGQARECRLPRLPDQRGRERVGGVYVQLHGPLEVSSMQEGRTLTVREQPRHGKGEAMETAGEKWRGETGVDPNCCCSEQGK